jgi:hypothetical protein
MRMMAIILCAALFAVWDITINYGAYTAPVVHYMKYRASY